MKVLELKNLVKIYNDSAIEVKAVDNIDLSFEQGEFAAIVGPSGSGKTTLLNMIGGLDNPTDGEIIVNDQNIGKLSSSKLIDFRLRNIGFVFQFHNLLPEFTAFENVCIPGFISGKSRSKVEARANELLGLLDLSDRLDHKPSELSGGEQQRVAVARALINDPAVILADEPSGNLDSKNKKELHGLFFDLREKLGQTFVIVTHDEQLAGISDRKLTIKDGLLVG